MILLNHPPQTTLLGDAQYQSIALDTGAVFDVQAGTESNMVSKAEVDAFNNAVRNYINWVESVRDLSSSLKDGWFKSALVNPPMLELAASCRDLEQGYSFNGYLCSPLNLMFSIHAHPNLVAMLDGGSQSWWTADAGRPYQTLRLGLISSFCRVGSVPLCSEKLCRIHGVKATDGECFFSLLFVPG